MEADDQGSSRKKKKKKKVNGEIQHDPDANTTDAVFRNFATFLCI